jgi:hydrogenase/urease accessory protein HupE
VSVRLQRTVLNWRWWAVAPLLLLLLPVAVVSWAMEGVSEGREMTANVELLPLPEPVVVAEELEFGAILATQHQEPTT